MSTLRQFVPLLFVPASAGILFRITQAQSLSEQLLVLALLIFCPELAWMAKVDLDNIAAVRAQPLPGLELPGQPLEDSRLGTFHKIVVSTIVLELLGFYAVLASLQWGGITIIFSQLWFNLLAKIQLFPQEKQSVISFGLFERWPVLVANVIGLLLLAVWSVCECRLWLSSALLALIALFLLIKYGLPVLGANAQQNDS